jgi:hypothetical protein
VNRILKLKAEAGKELNGTQPIAFFLQHRVQPLQARISKLWSYSGSKDQSRISQTDLTTKDFQKDFRSPTKLTKKLPVPSYLAMPYHSNNPILKVLEINLKLLCL